MDQSVTLRTQTSCQRNVDGVGEMASLRLTVLALVALTLGGQISAASAESSGFYVECDGGFVTAQSVELGHLTPDRVCLPQSRRCFGVRKRDNDDDDQSTDECGGSEPCFVGLSDYFFPRCSRFSDIDCVMVTITCLEDFVYRFYTVNYTFPGLIEITTTTAAAATTTATAGSAVRGSDTETSSGSQTSIGLAVGILLLVVLLLALAVSGAVICIKRRKLHVSTKAPPSGLPIPVNFLSAAGQSSSVPPAPERAVVPTAPPAEPNTYVGHSNDGNGATTDYISPYLTVEESHSSMTRSTQNGSSRVADAGYCDVLHENEAYLSVDASN